MPQNPWERYQQQEPEARPWEKYAAPPPATASIDDESKSQPGGFSRFLTRFTGLDIPEITAHPGAYLNPFSREYWAKGKEEASQPITQPSLRQMIPFGQTSKDVSEHGFFSPEVAGDLLPGAIAFGSMLGSDLEIPGPGANRVPVWQRAGVQAERTGPYIALRRPLGSAAPATEEVPAAATPRPAIEEAPTGALASKKVPPGGTPKPSAEDMADFLRFRINDLSKKMTGATPQELKELETLIAQDREMLNRINPRARDQIGTAAGAEADTALFNEARRQLGPNASFSQVALRAQRLKEFPPAPYRKGPGEVPADVVGIEGPVGNANPDVLAGNQGIIIRPPKQLKAAPSYRARTPDTLEDMAISQEMNEDLERHGRNAYREARRDWNDRNSVDVPKWRRLAEFRAQQAAAAVMREAELAQSIPTRSTPTRTPKPKASSRLGEVQATKDEELLPKLEESVRLARQRKAQQKGESK